MSGAGFILELTPSKSQGRLHGQIKLRMRMGMATAVKTSKTPRKKKSAEPKVATIALPALAAIAKGSNLHARD